ncbi:hypothetical protein HK102_001900, partial [Quaeritorhiza haematococci]
ATPESATFTESTLATGQAYESVVQNLVEMGFEREQVKAAMRAAFNNPDRAAEYLMTGIPESAREVAAPPPAAAAPRAPGAGAAPAPGAAPQAQAPAAQAGGQGFINLFEAAAQQAAQQQAAGPGAGAGVAGADANALGFLRNSPQFQQLRQLVQNQPQLLQPLLQQLGQNNPQLLQLINQNQDAFLQILNEPGEEGEGAAAGGAAPQYIHITPEENEAINRLVALGFERALAIEAFFACDKNEELAANYLFDHGQGDDWQ